MPTFTIFATEDTRIDSIGGASYAAAREGTGSFDASGSSSPLIGQWLLSGTSYRCYQAFFEFDVSSVAGTVASAILNLNIQSNDTDTDFIAELRSCSFAGPLAPSSAFVPGSQLASHTLYGSLDTTTIGANGTYVQFSDDGLSTAVQAGSDAFQCFVSSNRQRTGTAPTGEEFFVSRDSQTSGTSFDPFIDIETASAAGRSWGYILG